MEEERYNEISNDEAVIKLVGKISMEYPELFLKNLQQQIKLKEIIEEGLYEYDVVTRCKELITSDLDEKISYYLNVRRLEGISEATIYNYQLTLNKFSECFHKPLSSITTNDIRMWLAVYKSKNIEASTLNGKIFCLSKFFNFCLCEGYIQVNPMSRIKISKVPKRLKHVLSEEELEMLRNGCSTIRESALIEIGFSTGCRISEVSDANISDIDFENRRMMVIGKGDKQREVYFSTKCKMLLQEYIKTRKSKDNENALFVGIKEPYKRLKTRAIQVILDKIKANAGLSEADYITFHGLRRACGSYLINHQAPLEDIRQILGHESPSTTILYSQLNKEHIRHTYNMSMQ